MSGPGQILGPVLSEKLVPEPIDNWAHEARDDVDEQEKDVADLQDELGEQGDENSLEGGNHEGQHAQQQLKGRKEEKSDYKLSSCVQTNAKKVRDKVIN